ncbi:hypothetical protein KXV68_007455 [Aspergillus fumigatus]|nr:hypothetical protein KXV68_007455 [Aspergillus fumigatus]
MTDDLGQQPADDLHQRVEVAEPRSYRDAAIHSAVPTTKEEWEGLLKSNTSCLKGITVSRQAGVPEMAQYTGLYLTSWGPEHVQDEKTEIEILPKFILFLDKRSLAITKDCKAGLLQIQKTEDRRDAVAFLENFGDGFAMQATVGGRLFHSEDVSMLEGDALDKRENSLKIAAKASLTSKDSFSIAASMSSGTEMLQNNQLSTSSISEGILWCGVGGDPSLHGE